MSDKIRNSRVAVCIPSMDQVHVAFSLCLAQFMYDPGALLGLINVRQSNIAIARNILVQEAMASGADWLFFLDSDMTFPQSVLRRLLAHQRDIVGATYAQREAPFATLGRMVGQTLRQTVNSKVMPLVEMERMPAGCLLIHKRVFDKLARPYFSFGVDEETGGIIGEDYQFCGQARAAGFKIYCDTALSEELGHIGSQVVKVACEAEPVADRTIDARQVLKEAGITA